MPFAALLRAVLDAAPWVLASIGTGLYVAELRDDHAFAVAVDIHARLGGPDPKVLRERATQTTARKPMMTGAAPISVLVRAIESRADGGALAPWAVRELAKAGEIPVVIFERGTVEVTSLRAIEEDGASGTRLDDLEASGGWFRPSAPEA